MNHRSHASGAGARRGFTLVELVLVLSIMAVLSGLAAPRFINSTSRWRATAAAQRLAADLNMVRSRANSTSAAITVTLTFSTSQYQVSGMVDPDHPANAYIVSLGGTPYKAAISSTTLAGTTRTSGTSQISFDAFGTPSCGGTISLAVGGITKTVSIDSGTGRAQVQ